MVAPIAAAKIAHTAWRNRKPAAWIIGIAITAMLIPIFLLFSVIAAITGADAYCATETTTNSPAASMSSTALVEARKRGASTAGASVLARFATSAATTLPTPTRDYTGLYRLPAEYAAGIDNGGTTRKGRWDGPQDPITGDPSRDSRNFAPAATRAVMRALKKTDPITWGELGAMNVAPNGQALTDFTVRVRDMFTATFPHIPMTRAGIETALTIDAGTADNYGYGDAIAGGALITGDPIRAQQLATRIGGRAFGGTVSSQPTSANPTLALDGLYRELAAQDGIVIILTDTTPSVDVVEETQDATLATVMWVAHSGTPQPSIGVYVDATPDFAVILNQLEGIEGATAPGLVCDGVLGGEGTGPLTIDPSMIIAPDPAAQIAIATAREQLGEPYISAGGARPPVSWDCSKLTTYAWAQAGISLVPYSYTQWDQVQRIPESYAAPGDLIFWFRNGAHHVAIIDEITPGGQIFFVGAANPERGVTRDELTPGWYRDHLSGFGRVQRESGI